jgi:hypothetical protein
MLKRFEKFFYSSYGFEISMIVVIFIFTLLSPIRHRINIENEYKTYETIMEISDIKNIAALEDKSDLDVAKDFLDVGVNSIVFFENSIDSLKTNENFKISTDYDGLDLNVHGTVQGLAYVENGIKQVIKDDRRIYYRDENTLVIEGKLSDFVYNSSQVLRDFTGKKTAVDNRKVSLVEYMGLGFIDEELQRYKDNGINIVLRPVYFTLVQDGEKSIDRYMSFVEKFSPNQRLVIFGSEEMLGGEKNVDYLKEKMIEHNLIPVGIETSLQDGNIATKGLLALVQKMDYQATRLFSTLFYIQDRYDYGLPRHHQGQEIMNTYYRAITERNIRVIYFRPFHFKEGEIITDMSIYKQRFEELNARLDKYYGIKPVSAESPMQIMKKLDERSPVLILPIVAALSIIFSSFVKNKKAQLIFMSLVVIGAMGTIVLGIGRFYSLYALATTIIFPTLSIIYLLNMVKIYESDKTLKEKSYLQLFVKGVGVLTVCVLISFVGSVFVAAFYGDSIYMLEFKKFSGVKISQMFPLLITVFTFLSIIGVSQYFHKESSLTSQLSESLQKNVKVWQALLAFVMIGVLGLMIIRSGHDSNVEPATSELILRNVLEFITPARPRNKAIFLGFPALIIFVMISGKKIFKTTYILFAIAATIGQANILNTFSHIRTPFMMSVYRTVGEYIISVIITFFIALLFIAVENLIKRKKIHE